MRHLAPYQSGLWLAEYGDMRCQLCRIYRSTPQSQFFKNHPSASPPNNHSFFTKLRQQVNNRFNSGLLCSDCHNSIAWLPKLFEVDIAAGLRALVCLFKQRLITIIQYGKRSVLLSITKI